MEWSDCFLVNMKKIWDLFCLKPNLNKPKVLQARMEARQSSGQFCYPPACCLSSCEEKRMARGQLPWWRAGTWAQSIAFFTYLELCLWGQESAVCLHCRDCGRLQLSTQILSNLGSCSDTVVIDLGSISLSQVFSRATCLDCLMGNLGKGDIYFRAFSLAFHLNHCILESVTT